MPKLSPEVLDQSLGREVKPSSASQVVNTQNDIDQVEANVELPGSKRNNNEGRLTGRTGSLKEQQLSKSLAETSINQMTENNKELNNIAPFTPLTITNKVEGLPTPSSSQPNYSDID